MSRSRKTTSGTEPKPRKDAACDKRCPTCGKKLGEYRNWGESQLGERFAPIKIKCPRCGNIS